ncbi:GNAT family N-acetyltransferase [Sphingobacterium sp. HJSM2_6]|uniref:GNAT family N-acetyltransferase n=1 Tax=Sphingobacterium sp. HJSM2_6 TaxID=3366264 RepID=UPI003BDE3DA9
MLERKELKNDLIHLIPLEKSDFEWVYAAASDPEIWEQHPDRNRYTPVGFTQYFQKLLACDIPYLILDLKTEQVIGATSYYQCNEAQKSVAIGFTFLKKAYWGGTYNSSLKKLMIEYAFESLDSIYFHVRDQNLRSQKAIEKLGAVFNKTYLAEDNSSEQIEYILKKELYR